MFMSTTRLHPDICLALTSTSIFLPLSLIELTYKTTILILLETKMFNPTKLLSNNVGFRGLNLLHGANKLQIRRIEEINAHSAHSLNFPEFWLSTIFRINDLFSSKYCSDT